MSFSATIAGSGANFDVAAYNTRLSGFISTQEVTIPPSSIDTTWTALRRRLENARHLQSTGSFEATSTIIVNAPGVTDGETGRIQSLIATQTPQSLSVSLAVDVTVFTAPVLGMKEVYSPPPSPPPPSLPPGFETIDGVVAKQSGGGGSSDNSTIGIGIGLAVFGVIVLVVGIVLVRRYLNNRRTSTIVKAVPVQAAVGATSTTTTPPPGGLELGEDESKI